jgi:hypothetical protein
MTTPLPVISGGFRLANLYHSNDATFVNTYWLLAGSAIDPNSVATAFMAAYDQGPSFAGPLALHCADVTFDAVEVTPLDGISDTVVVQRESVTAGLATGPMAAANAAFIVTWLTGARGRSNRGRSFLAGCPNASLETGGGRWSSGFIVDANEAIQAFLDNLGNGDPALTLQVVSQHSVEGPHHRDVFEFIARQGVGTIRGRTERNKP